MKTQIIETMFSVVSLTMIAKWAVILIVLGFIIYLIIKSLVTIKPNENAVLIQFGKPVKVIGSGLHFCLWPFSSVVRYSKQPIILNIEVGTAMTKGGIVKGYKEDGKEVERTELDVILTLTTYFDCEKLITTLSNAPGNNAESLQYALGGFIISVVRAAASTMPWPLFNGNHDKVAKYIMGMIIPGFDYYDLQIDNEKDDSKKNVYSFKKNKTKSSLDGDIQKSPFIQFGLDLSRTTIDIKDVNFSNEEMRKAFNAGETARMLAEKAMIDADALADGIIKKGVAEAKASADKIIQEGEASARIIKKNGEAEAAARKLMIEEIKGHPDLEYLRSLVEMAKGTSNTILYQVPKGFEEKLSGLLGGGTPENFLSLLKNEKVLEVIKNEIEKLNKKEE